MDSKKNEKKKKMKTLRIPIARRVATGELLLPGTTTKDKGPFQCVQCNEDVYLRAKTPRRCAHFVHTPKWNSTRMCSGESTFHLAAKYIIAAYYNQFVFRETCHCCQCNLDSIKHQIKVPSQSRFEYRVEKYVVDIAILSTVDDKLTNIVEIHHTHAVDRMKWNVLHKACDQVFEVRAKEVIAVFGENPCSNEFNVTCKRGYHKLCVSCYAQQKCRVCKFCNRKELQTDMQKFNVEEWMCSECATKVRGCTVCKRELCFKSAYCDVCASHLRFLFGKRNPIVQIRLYMFFKRFLSRIYTRWVAKRKAKERELLQKIECITNPIPLAVPKRDYFHAKQTGCIRSVNDVWSVSGPHAWKCYNWWKDPYEKFVLSKMAPIETDYYWSRSCSRCHVVFLPTRNIKSKPKRYICPDCKTSNDVACLDCSKWLKLDILTHTVHCSACKLTAYVCVKCFKWTKRRRIDGSPYCQNCTRRHMFTVCSQCGTWDDSARHNIPCATCFGYFKSWMHCALCKQSQLSNRSKSIPVCFDCYRFCFNFVQQHVRPMTKKNNDCIGMFLNCKRILKRFIANCKRKLEHKARIWFEDAFATNKLVKLRVPKRHWIFLSLTGCFFCQCWQAQGTQLWTYARWLPRNYLRDFAYKYRPHDFIPCWEKSANMLDWNGKQTKTFMDAQVLFNSPNLTDTQIVDYVARDSNCLNVVCYFLIQRLA